MTEFPFLGVFWKYHSGLINLYSVFTFVFIFVLMLWGGAIVAWQQS